MFSWGIGETGELGREVCSTTFPPQPEQEYGPSYDFDGILRDHITPGGMYFTPEESDGEMKTRMDRVKVRGERQCLIRGRGGG